MMKDSEGIIKMKGLFDLEFRMRKIDKNGDPLKRLNELVDCVKPPNFWTQFLTNKSIE